MIVVRPEEVAFQPAENEHQPTNGTGNRIPGIIELRTFLGPFTRFHVRLDNQTTLTADIPSQQARNYDAGQRVFLVFPPSACQVLPFDVQDAAIEQLVDAEKV